MPKYGEKDWFLKDVEMTLGEMFDRMCKQMAAKEKETQACATEKDKPKSDRQVACKGAFYSQRLTRWMMP